MTPEQEQEQQANQQAVAQQQAADKSFLINAMMEEISAQRDSAMTQLAKEKATVRMREMQMERMQQQLNGTLEQNFARGQAVAQLAERVKQLETERDDLQSTVSLNAEEIERLTALVPKQEGDGPEDDAEDESPAGAKPRLKRKP